MKGSCWQLVPKVWHGASGECPKTAGSPNRWYPHVYPHVYPPQIEESLKILDIHGPWICQIFRHRRIRRRHGHGTCFPPLQSVPWLSLGDEVSFGAFPADRSVWRTKFIQKKERKGRVHGQKNIKHLFPAFWSLFLELALSTQEKNRKGSSTATNQHCVHDASENDSQESSGTEQTRPD